MRRTHEQARRLRKKPMKGATIIGHPMEAERRAQMATGTCAYCWRSGQKLEVDHVEPLIAGGAHSAQNTAYVCARCNGSKRGMFLLEWMSRRIPAWFTRR